MTDNFEENKSDMESEFSKDLLKEKRKENPETQFREKFRTMMIRRAIKFGKTDQMKRRMGNYYSKANELDWFFERY